MNRERIDVKATDRNLVISAERPASNTVEKNAPLLKELRVGAWSRSFRFPPTLDQEQLKASYKDGILEIKARKALETIVSMKVDS